MFILRSFLAIGLILPALAFAEEVSATLPGEIKAESKPTELGPAFPLVIRIDDKVSIHCGKKK